MNNTDPAALLRVALLLGACGLVVLLVGVAVWKLLGSSTRAHQLGFDSREFGRLPHLERFFAAMKAPGVMIPLTFMTVGFTVILFSIILAIMGVIMKYFT